MVPVDDQIVPTGTGPRRRGLAGSQIAGLLVASRPVASLLTALALAGAALLAGRPLREAGLVGATVLVGQVILAWDNDLVDRERDARHERARKPLASGWVAPGNAWYAIVVAALLLVPLSIANGLVAAGCYLASVLLGMVGNRGFRRSPLSFLPWAIVWGLYPYFIVAGGWGGTGVAALPDPTVVALFAGLGISLHVLRSLPGLVADREDGSTSLPLMIAMRTGATPLLIVSVVTTLALVAAIIVVGQSSELRA
ncbi:UbiA family prenyltransferase [Nocardioides rotundus]|uniref:UbiA family prenyltransferase n=1 Tax=Nocardioides rotundus TaxID=1774216 RepID=UPI001CBBEA3F|nr:UbiA family prenyltransferase [Nocardioides rotundus]UAL29133.1 UbiA family prenyltransferase [Nocardioides rotundus]